VYSVQLEIANEVVHQLEKARDRRPLASHKEELEQELKLKSLGLSSLQQIIARQESCLLWLNEDDTLTHFFHAHASGRWRGKYIRLLVHDGRTIIDEEGKAVAAFNFFDNIPGYLAQRCHTINLEVLSLPSLDLEDLSSRFTEFEILDVIKALPPDKAPGPDDFTAKFLQSTWHIIRADLMAAFDAFWQLDSRNFHDVNEALLTLLPKSAMASSLKVYMPISLIHMVGKLIFKVIANRLALRLGALVHPSQSAFIKSRFIQDNYKVVQSTARLLHARDKPCLLLKVDLARAIDSVAWPFMLEVLQHARFPRLWINWISTLLSLVSMRILLN
jgi:hypothetical protein